MGPDEPHDESEAFLNAICSEPSLREAWRHLNKSNPDSYGLSGETISDFRINLDANIPIISQSLKEGKFKFSKNRASLIPKDNGKLRPLQIPEIRDRLVLKSIALQIENELSHKLDKSIGVSFAYQKGVGIKDAMEKVLQYYHQGYTWVLEADIISFFDRVDKNRLLNEFIFPETPNSPIIKKLIEKSLEQKLDKSSIKKSDLHYFDGIEKGIPQGNPLSPLFSNIYLYKFDNYMIEQTYKLIRYADDFIVMLKSESDASLCYDKISRFLKNELGLDLHPIGTKSRIVNLDKEAMAFLSINFDGKHLYPTLKNFNRFKESIDALCYSDIETRTILEILQRVKNALDGWLSSYFFTDIDRYFDELDSYINKQLYMALHKKDWKFTAKVRGRIKSKYRKGNTSPDSLSDTQRKYSGVPFCNEIILERRNQNSSKF